MRSIYLYIVLVKSFCAIQEPVETQTVSFSYLDAELTIMLELQ